MIRARLNRLDGVLRPPSFRVGDALFAAALALAVVAAVLFGVGWVFVDYYPMVAGLVLQFALNVAYTIRHIRDQLLHTLLYFGIFLFLLTRPVIGIFYGTGAWYADGEEATLFSLIVIYLSLVALLVGAMVAVGSCGRSHSLRGPGGRAERRASHRFASARLRAVGFFQRLERSSLLRALRAASLMLLLVCLAFSLIEAFQMLRYMAGRTYVEYHLISTSAYSSSFVTSISGMFSYALCAFLATLPSRRPATAALVVNVGLTVPDLVIGSRFSFVGAVLLMAFYYLFRQVTAGRSGEQWITKRLIVFSLVALPVGLVFLGSLNYIRAGTSFGAQGLLLPVADALYKQGVTFKVLQYGYLAAPDIAALGPKFFVFGDLINTITQGFVGQVFLGCQKLPDTNSVELALSGNLYAHTLSYFSHSNYLGGEGWGSSYLLESFADGGYAGVAGFSFVLSFALSKMSRSLGTGWGSTFFVVLASRSIYMAPRGDSLAWLSFAWSTRFWLFVVCLLVFACVLHALAHGRLTAMVGRAGRPPCALRRCSGGCSPHWFDKRVETFGESRLR